MTVAAASVTLPNNTTTVMVVHVWFLGVWIGLLQGQCSHLHPRQFLDHCTMAASQSICCGC